MATALSEIAKERGIKYFLFSFTDLFGVMRAKLVPAAAADEMTQSGAGFGAFAAWLDSSPAEPDVLAIPDINSLIQLPWKPEVAWLATDLWCDGKEYDQTPRNTLKRVLAKADAEGYRLKHGVECEFHLILPDGSALADARDQQAKPCYDVSALMRASDIVMEICDYMQELGWGPYQNDHEDANGQFEMNWDFADALVTADRHIFFKFMVKSVAEKHGLRATFMPKPFAQLTGNGCHAHISLWDRAGETNLFADETGTLGLSETAYHFMGGLLAHAPALCAFANPTVNSYKRLNAPRTSSGATWSPNTITYGGNNRSHMVRIPDAGRFELRLADGATNPYFLPAAILAAGLDGIENKTSPGKRVDLDMYSEGHKVRGAKLLPLNLLDALRALSSNKTLKLGLDTVPVDAFIKLKTDEWHDYTRQLTDWERRTTLDC